MKTTYQKDDRLPQHTAVGNDDTPITYPTSPHEWMSVKAVVEKDGRIAELEAVNERLETENHHLQTAAADVMAENVRLEAENAENLKLLYGRDLEIERLTAALGQCSQARAELAANLSAVLSGVDLDYERSEGAIWVEQGVSYARPKIAVRDIEQAVRVLEGRP